jgi:hypothetical protein
LGWKADIEATWAGEVAVKELVIRDDFYITPDADQSFEHGRIYHIARNRHGGSRSTQIAYFHVWNPDIPAEGFFPHRRLDVFVMDHKLAPDAAWLARKLYETLETDGVVADPVWLGWHQVRELGGEQRGEVFDYE